MVQDIVTCYILQISLDEIIFGHGSDTHQMTSFGDACALGQVERQWHGNEAKTGSVIAQPPDVTTSCR